MLALVHVLNWSVPGWTGVNGTGVIATGGDTMIRKLLLPAVAIALLGGCVSAGYSYRQGRGDYYHGAPSVEYRYYGGSGYGWPQPYGYYGSFYRSHGYGLGYGYPYGYGHYGDPYRNYYSYPYRSPYHRPHHQPRAQPTVEPQVDTTPDGNRSHWRELDRLRRRDRADLNTPIAPRADMAPQPRSQPESDPAPRGSAFGGMLRRAGERAGDDGTSP